MPQPGYAPVPVWNGSGAGLPIEGHANLENILIYTHADKKMKRKAIEKASLRICGIDAGTDDPSTLDDDTLKHLYGFR